MPKCKACDGEYSEGAGFCPTCGAGVSASDAEAVIEHPTAASAPAAWLQDPTGRHELRYWDSQAWTNHVSDAGVTSVEGEPQATAQPQVETVAAAPRGRMSGWQRAPIVSGVIAVAVLALSFGGLQMWRNGTPGNPLNDYEKLMRRAPRDGRTEIVDIVYNNEANAFSGEYEFYEADDPDRYHVIWADEVQMVFVDGEESVDHLLFCETIQGPEPLSGTVQFTKDGISALTITTQE